MFLARYAALHGAEDLFLFLKTWMKHGVSLIQFK